MTSPVLPGQRVFSAADAIYPILKATVTLFTAALGMLLCGMLGSVAVVNPPGAGALVGAAVGFALGLSLGCCATGLHRDFISDDRRLIGHAGQKRMPPMIPHGDFDLILTVHEAVGADVRGRLPWASLHLYVEAQCGANPVKRTCVKADGKFNEQFKIRVAAADDLILLRLKDQDVFGATDVGYVAVNIQQDVVDAGFPLRQAYALEASESDSLRFGGKQQAQLVLSFDYTDDYPPALRPPASMRDASSRRGQPSLVQETARKWRSPQYGAVNFLTKLEFKPSVRVGQEPSIARIL